MVNAYVTRIGPLQAALNQERFLVENQKANSILSLEPAVQWQTESRPQPFAKIQGFSTRETALEVQWEALNGLEAYSGLFIKEGGAMALTLELVNKSENPFNLAAALPVFVSAEKAGACALGMQRLRTIASRPAHPFFLAEMDSRPARQEGFGVWFPQTEEPALLLAVEGGDGLFLSDGSRGKVLNLQLSLPVEQELAPGENWKSPEILFFLEEEKPWDILTDWANRQHQERLLAYLSDLNPGGELPEEPEEPIVEESPPDEPEVEETAEPSGEAQPVEAEEEPLVEEEETPLVDENMEENEFPPLGRTALFHRAQRLNDDYYPRWGGGRKKQPLDRMTARGKILRRRRGLPRFGQSEGE